MNQIKKLLPKLMIANFGIMAFSQVYFLLPMYLSDKGITDPGAVGWILGAFFFASTFPRPFLAYLVEALPLRRLVFAASFLCFSAGVGIVCSKAVVPLIFWRLLAGLGFGLFLVALTTYQTFVIPEEVRGSAFALITVGSIFPFIVVLPAGDFMLHRGMGGLYIWLAPLMALVCAFVSLTLRPAKRGQKQEKENWGSWRELLSLKLVKGYLVSAVIYGLTDAAIISVTSLAMEKDLPPSAFMVPFAWGALLIRLLGFKILDIVPKGILASLVIGVNAIGLIGAALASNNLIFGVSGLIYGIGVGIGFPLYLALVGEVTPRHLRPKATALAWFLLDGCYFVTPIIFGYLSEFLGASGAFRALPIFLLAAASPVYFFCWRSLVKKELQR